MSYRIRYWILLGVMALASLCVIYRLFDLHVLERGFLLKQSQARIRRVVSIPAHRGMILDRNNKPLAISARVNSVWINPAQFVNSDANINIVANMLDLKSSNLKKQLEQNKEKRFLYIKRGISPELGIQLKELDLAGLYIQNSSKRFYPEAEVTAHVIGFTNVDDRGQEGIELAYDQHLRGIAGKKEVVKDRRGHIVGELNSIREPEEGHDLILSIDSGMQYAAYCALEKAVHDSHAAAGSIVVMDVRTGEILAMVNQPTYNPNHIVKAGDGRLRNRAMTDQYEPGSTVKAFAMAGLLKSGKFKPTDIINTNPGWMNIEGYTVHDVRNHGRITVAEVIQKSSNVGLAKMAMKVDPELVWQTMHDFGFGESSYSGFPGEASGSLVHEVTWRPTDVTSMTRGYGMAVTTVQMAHAFATLANDGVALPVSLLKLDHVSRGERKLSHDIVTQVVDMLESVTQKGGTGRRARVRGFRVAGKTGTAYIAGPSGYDKEHYMASFVGFAPVSSPRLVVAVALRDPKHGHYGGVVAAPAFAKVMSGGLRLLAVAPDNIIKEH